MRKKAEKTLSEDSREKVVEWLRAADWRSSIESYPSQFAVLFDRIFSERHLSWRCFYVSAIVSIYSAMLLTAGLVALNADVIGRVAASYEVGDTAWHFWALVVGSAYGYSMLFNVVPDYLSLLETRWAIGRMRRGGVIRWLVLDFVLTASLSAVAVVAIASLTSVEFGSLTGLLGDIVTFEGRDGLQPIRYLSFELNLLPVFFYTAFVTSLWLWLYAGTLATSRVLLRMNNGVGFLLRVTDVEKQPFRSMGFVSVIIISVIFALGLPLVLL